MGIMAAGKRLDASVDFFYPLREDDRSYQIETCVLPAPSVSSSSAFGAPSPPLRGPFLGPECCSHVHALSKVPLRFQAGGAKIAAPGLRETPCP